MKSIYNKIEKKNTKKRVYKLRYFNVKEAKSFYIIKNRIKIR